jgi:DeoR family transcriptional regulator, suf operon transcriptional repressor
MSITHHPSTKEDILRYLMRQGEATAQQLAEALAISPQAVRRHLKDLEAEQLLGHQTVQAGMGRPQHVYHLSKTGRSHFPEAYDQFALGLLDTLAANFTPEQVQEILRQQWQRKAENYRSRLGQADLADRLALLVSLRRSEGYMTEWRALGAEELATLLQGAMDGTLEAGSLRAGEHLGAGNPSDLPGEISDPDAPGEAAAPMEAVKGGTVAHAGGVTGIPDSASGYLLTEFHCAIASVAESFPNVCDHELELFMATFPDCRVERTHWMIEGEHRCGYLIRPQV